MAVGAKNGNGNGTSWIWPSVVSAFTALVGGFILYVISTISAEQMRLERSIERQADMSAKTYTSIAEELQYRVRMAEEIKRLDEYNSRDNVVKMRMRDQFLTKETYNARHEPLIADITRLTERLNEFRKEGQTNFDSIRKDFGSTYTLTDKIKDLERQIQTLQSQVIRSQSVVPSHPKPASPSQNSE